MSTKKLKDNNALFRAKALQSTDDIQKSEEEKQTLINKYIERSNKEKEYVDVQKLVDAPAEWNTFPPLPEVKMIQLKLSIFENGIWVPVIAWEQDNGEYIILSGHNRVHAVKELISENKRDIWKHDYDKIPCIIYRKDEIDVDKANEIIIDTNYIQRGELSPKLRVSVIQRRIKIMKTQKNAAGETIDSLISTLNLRKTAIYEDIQIGTQIIPELQDLYFNGIISRKAVLKFTNYSEETQRWIFDTFNDKLTTKKILMLNKNVKMREQIAEVFESDPSKEDSSSTKTSITVPKNKLKSFRQVCDLYLTDPEFVKMCNQYIRARESGEE